MCDCGSQVPALHEIDCDEYVCTVDMDALNLSFRQDAERAKQRTIENTAYLRRRTLARANGHAKDYNLIAV